MFFLRKEMRLWRQKGAQYYFPSQEGNGLRKFWKEQPFAGLLQIGNVKSTLISALCLDANSSAEVIRKH
jgi:hypothetical protein